MGGGGLGQFADLWGGGGGGLGKKEGGVFWGGIDTPMHTMEHCFVCVKNLVPSRLD